MADRIIICSGALADFSTAPWGVLEVVNGKVVLNEAKAFNRARRHLHVGVNYFRILRRGIWSLAKDENGKEYTYDWQTPGYWAVLKVYLKLLHQPYQAGAIGKGKGARVWYEIIDGCSENWYFSDYEKARRLYRAAFANLGDLDYVVFGVGNEMYSAKDTAFIKAVAYPEFKRAGKIPFSYGAGYSLTKNELELQKRAAAEAWNPPADTAKDIWKVGDAVAGSIYRPVHTIKDKDSEKLINTVHYWIRRPGKSGDHPIPIIWSCDGVKDGKSDCDYYLSPTGVKGDVRPSVAEWRSAIKFVLDWAKVFKLANGQPKFGFEWIGKAVNMDFCVAKGIKAISDEYHAKWGTWPENYGKYPDDWAEPPPPPPPGPPAIKIKWWDKVRDILKKIWGSLDD